VAVSVDAITQADLSIPRPDHPFLTPDGSVDPIWYRFLADQARMINSIKELTNAIKTEVDTQHP
jgi:hypothetical protein